MPSAIEIVMYEGVNIADRKAVYGERGSYTRICLACKDHFPIRSYSIQTRCCSYKCSVVARTLSSPKICETCGIEFASRGPASKTRFCSKICAGVRLIKQVTQACDNCGVVKQLPPSHANRQEFFTCSRKCHFEYRKNNEQMRLQISSRLSASIRKRWEEDAAWAKARRFALSKRSMLQIKEWNGKRSSAETNCAEILNALGIEFEEQYLVVSESLSAHKLYDFYLPQYDVLLEVHGTYWHADPRQYADRNKLTRTQTHNVANDEVKAAIAAATGKRLYVVWEADLSDEVIQAIDLFPFLKEGECAP